MDCHGRSKPICHFAVYKSETKFSEGVLHYKRTFEIKEVTVPTEKLAEVRVFLEQWRPISSQRPYFAAKCRERFRRSAVASAEEG
jgi:hypothetical protein